MKGLSGKVTVVTGAAQGIGFAIAMRLAEEGARVAIADVNDRGAIEAAARIGKAAMGVCIDVTNTVSIAAGVAAVVERLGPIDVLVNNAGWDKVEPFVKSEEATWDKVIALNLKGPIACARAVLDSMIERRSGNHQHFLRCRSSRIGGGGSVCRRESRDHRFFKDAGARAGPLRDQRQCRLPGSHQHSPLSGDVRWERETRRVAQTCDSAGPPRRARRSAGVVAFLASDDASFITGQTLSVSGGLTMV